MRQKFLLLTLFLTFLCARSFGYEEENAFIVCDNGLEMFAWDLEFIRQANHSVEIAACFSGGTILRELLTELEARMEVARALRVYLLITPILMESEDKKMIVHLEKKFPERFHFQHASNLMVVWPDVTGIDNHVKMCVVDETYFSTGGTNLDQSLCSDGTYTPPRNKNKGPPMGGSLPAGARDQDVVGRGPLAKNLRETFYKVYCIWEHYNKTKKLEKDPETFRDNIYYRPIPDTEKLFVEKFETYEQLFFLKPEQLRYIICGPHQKNNAITKEYVKLIREAKDEILIANLYFLPCDAIFEALLDAINRGVKTVVITNGIGKVPPEYTKFFCWAHRMTYVPAFYGRTFHLWQAASCAKMALKNTRIFEYNVADILFHKKVMLVDGKKFVVGSYNLGSKSHLSDYETILIFDSPEMTEAARVVFEKDLRFSVEVTPAQARSWYFDPITSYLGELQKKFHGLL